MQLLPRVVTPAVALVIAAGCACGLAGCSQFNSALAQQEAVVSFKSDATTAQRLVVRAACGKLRGVTPVPLPAGVSQAVSLSEVIYRVDHASNADKARLQQCLARYPSVAGLTFQDSTDVSG
jgi:hypothetical protein